MMKPDKQNKQMAAAKKSAIADIRDDMPEYMSKGTARGSENVTNQDTVIPRLEVVQSLSPCRLKNDPNYIPGAEEGLLYNSVSRQLYGASVTIVPVFFQKEYLLWKSRKSGGGFRGAYRTEQEARARAAELLTQGEDDVEVVDTPEHFCLIVDDKTGKMEPVVLSMPKSKSKISRKWNSLVRMVGGDRFSRIYTVTTMSEKNPQGQSYYNLAISQAGYPSEPVYRAAEDFYTVVSSGSVAMSKDYEPDDVQQEETKEY